MRMSRVVWLGAMALVSAACSDDETNLGSPDAASVPDSSTPDTSVPDAPSETSPEATVDAPPEADALVDAGDGGIDLLARGEYLVKHVTACGDCHTRRVNGQLDPTHFLAGNPTLFDLDPSNDTKGAVPVPNITPDPATGIGNWTPAEIKAAIKDGRDKDGTSLFPIMPYWALHNLTDQDADAIVAYLRSIPAVVSQTPPRQVPYPVPLVALQYLPDSLIPMPAEGPNKASALRGRYLAAKAAACIDCHTAPSDQTALPPPAFPIEVSKMFQGKRLFVAAELGLPPIFPAQIYSRNLTPHHNGIEGWTAAAIAAALRQGKDKDNIPLCPPMPAGPMAAFGGLTPEDALDLGNYFTTIPAMDNGVIPNCAPMAAPEGGTPEGGQADGGDAGDASDGG